MTNNFSRFIERPIVVYKLKDHPLFEEFFSILLQQAGRVVLVSSAQEETRTLLQSYQPDVLLYLSDTIDEALLAEIHALQAEVVAKKIHQSVITSPSSLAALDSLYDHGIDQVLSLGLKSKKLMAQIKKTLEQSLTARKYELLDAALNSMRASLVITDTHRHDNPIIYVSSSFEHVTGYPLSETLDRNCRFLQSEDHNQPNLETLRDAIKNRKECSVLLRNYRKNGEMFWNELNIAPLAATLDLEKRYVVGLQYNVSGLVEPLQAITQKETQLRNVMELYPAYVWLLKSPKQWTFINQAGRQLIGDEKAANWSAAVHPEDMGILIEALNSAWASSYPARCEVRVQSASGQIRQIQHTFTSMFNEMGERYLIIGSGMDVTEFRTTEKILNDRQRLMTASSFLQKSFSETQDATRQFNAAKSIISEALNASEIRFFRMTVPNDFSTLEEIVVEDGDPNSGRDQRLSQLLRQHTESLKQLTVLYAEARYFEGYLRQHTESLQQLTQSENANVREQKEQVIFVPIMVQTTCQGLIRISYQQTASFGRIENDFLRNIRALILSSRFWLKQ